MAGMKKADIRRQGILADLKAGDRTLEELKEKYSSSSETIKADIKYLRGQGLEIDTVRSNTQNRYSIKQESAEEAVYFEKTSSKNVRKLFLMLILQKKDGMSFADIKKAVVKYSRDKNLKYYSNSEEDAGEYTFNTIRNDLKELLEEKLIKERNELYYVSSQAPLQLVLSEEDAEHVFMLLENCAKGSVYEKVLNGIKKKMTDSLFYETKGADENYYVYKRKYEEANRIEGILNELNKYPFETKQLEIKYKGNSDSEVTIYMSVGNIVYSLEKDRVYLLGHSKGKPMVIAYNQIKSIRATSESNQVFRNDFYKRLVNTMFGISVEEPVHVKVEFDNRIYIREKINRILKNRPEATVSVEGNVFIYEDNISGMHDFARYLRGYGSGCRVLQPKKLQNILKNGAQRTLEFYAQMEESDE